SLVATLFRLGELEPARSLILQLLNLRLGSSSDSDCVSTVATASAIVTRLLDLKCWSEAVEIQEAVVRLLRHVRGERDLDTLREVWLLAIIVLELGDIRQARLLLQCIVTPFSRLLGRTHSETLRAFSFLAALMAAQGDCTSARAILQRSYTVAIESGIDPAVICNLSGELSALDAFACHNPPDPGLSSSVRTLHLPSWKQ
ncbi:MAG: tetratricopeptide repeat protein, partial [Acidobacteriaceae bacterium]|nr:tetratricopeptide repeat protein [Acidobacteriaceae bacterium]